MPHFHIQLNELGTTYANQTAPVGTVVAKVTSAFFAEPTLKVTKFTRILWSSKQNPRCGIDNRMRSFNFLQTAQRTVERTITHKTKMNYSPGTIAANTILKGQFKISGILILCPKAPLNDVRNRVPQFALPCVLLQLSFESVKLTLGHRIAKRAGKRIGESFF